jgi:hypothetical protein
VALGFIATQASAQGSAFGVEYRWLASLDMPGEPSQLVTAERKYPSTTFMDLMVKSFVRLGSVHDRQENDLATAYFRPADPDFGLPQAFRRPRQLRLGFSIHF